MMEDQYSDISKTMDSSLILLRKELENKNQMIERLQKTNEQLSEKVTKLLEDKINYLQQK